MSRLGTVFLCLVVWVGLNGCGSSGGGGTGGTAGSGGRAAGSGGAAGQGGAGGGAAGTGGTGGALAACGTSTAASTGTTCNTFDATGPCVAATLGTGPAPTPGGGPIQVGTYELQSRTAYASADAGIIGGSQMLRQTLVLSGGAGGVFTTDTVNVNGARIARQHGTATVSGSQVDFTPSCPAAPDGGSSGTVFGYTATTSTLTTFNTTTTGIVVVDVYTMR